MDDYFVPFEKLVMNIMLENKFCKCYRKACFRDFLNTSQGIHHTKRKLFSQWGFDLKTNRY